MDDRESSAKNDDDLPRFSCLRTSLLLGLSWLLGYFLARSTSPELPVFAHVIVGLLVGVILVGTVIRIF